MKFQLTLVRHGETDANKNQIVQSFSDQGLNNAGREQSALLGKYLKEKRARYTKFIASGLLRTHETLEIILENLCPGGRVQFAKDPRLNEKGFGETMEGKPLPEFVAAIMSKGDPLRYKFPDGESYESARARAASFFKDLCREVGKNQCFVEPAVLVVTSGSCFSHLLDFFNTEPGYEFVDANGKPAEIEYVASTRNTAFTQLQIQMTDESKVKVRLLTLRDTSHFTKK